MVQIKTPNSNRKDWEKYFMPNPDTIYRTKRIEEAVNVNNKDSNLGCKILEGSLCW